MQKKHRFLLCPYLASGYVSIFCILLINKLDTMETQYFSQEDAGQPALRPLSVKDWLITLVLTAIPIVGLILLFYWGFSDDTHPSKENWAKAALLFYLILIVLNILFFVFFIGSFAYLGSNI